ncbi:MAG: Smr/MutS family protein [Spirochaetaceae bacterium]|nr:Smr/MutS family protein [Spirochaetaceae bacterium]
MNFGDILDAWEQEQKDASKKTSKSTGQEWRNKKTQPDSAANESGSKSSGVKTDGAGPASVKKNVKSGGNTNDTRINPMTEWLRRYGVVDKDAVAEKAAENEKQKDRAWLLDMPYEAQIDLHGLTADEATVRLDQFVGECYKRGIRKILIIHGKGNHSEDAPVLSGMVRSFIERDYRLGESGHPDKKDGGKGATWVILREKTVLG